MTYSNTAASSNVGVVLGLMTWGREGTEGARVHTFKQCEEMLDIFQKHGHKELDTAFVYTSHTSEQMLGEIDWKKRGLIVDTKLYPSKTSDGTPITHSRADLRKFLDMQLEACKTTCFDMWYLHAPDRKTDFAKTFAAVDELYREGKFKRFGISNYMSWEVAHIVELCDKNGWIKPTAYQGIYNALHRNVEPELFPCLRKFGISFYEFNPLAGGLFTGRYSGVDMQVENGSRFDPATGQGQNYRKRYFNDRYFEALALIEPIAKKHDLTMCGVALRWINHHSLLKRNHGDQILIGASSHRHLEDNLIDLEKGPLPEEVVNILDEAWEIFRPVATKVNSVGETCI
ncbi:BQ2448_446 [Microbotryum intermedium]|uniref:BQ2448_446 protein n=1 Tax=Microbotryum intermedium TaxID=269621 RepID=A0A238F5G8_9BASI|nr:BQ2448_446 [Microbotryum intermedium]